MTATVDGPDSETTLRARWPVRLRRGRSPGPRGPRHRAQRLRLRRALAGHRRGGQRRLAPALRQPADLRPRATDHLHGHEPGPPPAGSSCCCPANSPRICSTTPSSASCSSRGTARTSSRSSARPSTASTGGSPTAGARAACCWPRTPHTRPRRSPAGLCSGLRDVDNLARKLAAVIKRGADPPARQLPDRARAAGAQRHRTRHRHGPGGLHQRPGRRPPSGTPACLPSGRRAARRRRSPCLA